MWTSLPGRYRLRIAAQDGNSERVGAVHLDTDIPHFAKLPLAMSGVMLTSSRAGKVPNAPPIASSRFARSLPGPPSLSRSFREDEVLNVLTEIYVREKTLNDVTVATTIKTIEGQELRRQETRRTGAQISSNNGVYPYTATILLANLPVGRYVLA